MLIEVYENDKLTQMFSMYPCLSSLFFLSFQQKAKIPFINMN
jgi:hypothetical protein